jgi:PDZ domain-containing protein
MKTKRSVGKTLVWIVAILVVVGVGLWFTPTNYLAVAPGITGNLSQMVEVSHGHSPGRGKLLMVAVEIGQLNELLYLGAKLDPNVEILPLNYATGGLDMKQYEQLNYAMMSGSKLSAEVAGERLAGLNASVTTVPGAQVEGVLKSGTAAGKLKAGDLIVAVGPYKVTSPIQIRTLMQKHFTFGQIVPFTVIRHHQRLVIPIKTMHLAGDPAPAIGVVIGQDLDWHIPRPVTIKSENIGGPSAGMMFALEIYDQITGKNLARGRVVAGTGEIAPNGTVSQIGGVAQKVITVHRAGATIFLCPQANYAKALHMARSKGYHMTIYPVKTLAQALKDIEIGTSANA